VKRGTPVVRAPRTHHWFPLWVAPTTTDTCQLMRSSEAYLPDLRTQRSDCWLSTVPCGCLAWEEDAFSNLTRCSWRAGLRARLPVRECDHLRQ
jgi:hypothetical protein